MPVSVPNPYTGKDDDTCSVSFAAQQAYAGGVSSPQTEAEYNRSKLAGEWGAISAKANLGIIPNGVKVLTYVNTSSGGKGYVYIKSGKLHVVSFDADNQRFEGPLLHPKDVDYWISTKTYKVTIPQAVAPTKKDTGPEPKLADKAYLVGAKDTAQNGWTVAATESGQQKVIFIDKNLHLLEKQTNGSYSSVYDTPSGNVMWANLTGEAEPFYQTDHKGVINGTFPKPKAATKDDPFVAAPVPAAPVNSGSDSVGSMSNEDVAAMFVKIKDDLAKEKGLNIKGANPDLDVLVYKEIGEKTGYTGAEVKGKIDQYKADGNKLSALKKKVLLGTKKVPDPKPNAVPTKATATIVNDVKATVKETVAADPNKHYTDEDVAAQYIIAKDKIVAESDGKWTLYSKSDQMDGMISSAIYEQTGVTATQQKAAIANYLGSGKKLSTLKKQLAKQGAFTPKADTLKKSGSDKNAADKAKEVDAKADAGYTPSPTPATAGKAGEPLIDTGKPAPKRVEKESAEAGSIDHISEHDALQIYTAYKGKGHLAYLSSGPGSNYDALVAVQAQYKAKGQDYTLLQLIRVIDDQGAKKFKADNTKLLEKQTATWLTSPEGAAHIKANEVKLAKLLEAEKKKAEVEKLAKELEANQPSLPADSAQFQEMTPSKALDLQLEMLKAKPFGPGEKAAIQRYTGEAYVQMNGHLRGIKSPYSVDQASIDAIPKAKAGMRPSPEAILVRRGTGANQFESLGVGRGETSLMWGLTGKTFKDEGFLSTSAAGRAAFGGEVALEIEAPKGTPMMYVDKLKNADGTTSRFSKHQGENEMLLQAGMEYKILNVRKEGSTFVVRLRVTNWPGKVD